MTGYNVLKTFFVMAGFFWTLSASYGVGAVSSQEPLTQALNDRASQDGFEVLGIDQIGGETVSVSSTDHSVRGLRKLLAGYSYILELAPDPLPNATERKPMRVRILGRAGDGSGDGGSTTQFATANGSGLVGSTVSAADQPSSDAETHPIAHMLQTVARTTIQQPGNESGQAVSSHFGVSQSAGASGTGAAATVDTAPAQADMAALTRAASANVSALVSGLKAACPAGSKC